MKLTIILSFALFGGIPVAQLSSQQNTSKPCHNNAEITNADKSMRPCNNNDPCNCPGGFFIHIDGVPNPKGKCISCTFFKTMQFPDGFSLGDDPQYPIAVTIDWQYDSLSCDSSRISIIAIAKRKAKQ